MVIDNVISRDRGAGSSSYFVTECFVFGQPSCELNRHILSQFANQFLHDLHEMIGRPPCIGNQDARPAVAPGASVQKMRVAILIERQVLNQAANALKGSTPISPQQDRKRIAIRLR